MKNYQMKGVVEAERFDQTTDEAQEEFASRVNGRLRGMSLKPADRVVQVDIQGMEHELEEGDWLVLVDRKPMMVLEDERFHQIFEEV